VSAAASASGRHEELAGLCAQISATVGSGSDSATLNELLNDPGAAICDGEGRVLACGSGRHVGAFSAVATAAAAGWSFATGPGSVVLLNDPFGGGTRVLDFYAVHEVELDQASQRWLAISRCTGADLGGNCFGGYNPTATEVWAEGARITPLRVREGGTSARETLACVTLNSRTPNLLAAQLRAMIGAVVEAGARLPKLIDELGGDPVAVADACLAPGAAASGRSMPVPQPAAEVVPVHSSDGDERGRVSVEARHRDGTLILDLSSSTATSPGYTNATRATTVSAALAGLVADGAEPVPDEALLRSVEVITEPGTIVDAGYPAPTMCGELAVAAAVRAAVAAAAGVAAPQRPGQDRGILGADGRLAEALAESLREDEARAAARANGGQPWQ
jgi:N-methylhydantoinase B